MGHQILHMRLSSPYSSGMFTRYSASIDCEQSNVLINVRSVYLTSGLWKYIIFPPFLEIMTDRLTDQLRDMIGHREATIPITLNYCNFIAFKSTLYVFIHLDLIEGLMMRVGAGGLFCTITGLFAAIEN